MSRKELGLSSGVWIRCSAVWLGVRPFGLVFGCLACG